MTPVVALTERVGLRAEPVLNSVASSTQYELLLVRGVPEYANACFVHAQI